MKRFPVLVLTCRKLGIAVAPCKLNSPLQIGVSQYCAPPWQILCTTNLARPNFEEGSR